VTLKFLKLIDLTKSLKMKTFAESTSDDVE